MASLKTKFTVGLFVASGIGIGLLVIVWLGMSRFFEKGQHYAAYFNESVQGLQIDSPVKFRGVSIGRVDSIGVAPDSKLIQVILKIESGQTMDSRIVAQLKSVGITGSKFVELDIKKKGEPDRSPLLSFPSEYPIVASKPSEISELFQDIDDILSQVKSLDFKGIFDKTKLALDNMNQAIVDANVKTISTNIESSLQSVDRILDDKGWSNVLASAEEAGQSFNLLMNKTNKRLNQVESILTRVEAIVDNFDKDIKSAILDFKQTMGNTNVLLQNISSLTKGTDDTLSHLKRSLLITGQNLEKASENLNRLSDILANQPSQLIFGQPPLPRKVEQEHFEK